MEYDELTNNEFIKTLVDLSQEHFKKTGLKEGKGRSGMTKEEKYVADTFQVLSELLTRVESLCYYIAFINSYPRTVLWKKSFGRVDYIRYHTEAYSDNIVRIYDRCLLLVNRVYKLGLAENKIGFEKKVLYKLSSDSPTYKALLLLKGSIENVKGLRNFTSHRGSYSDKELDDLGLYEFLLRKSTTLTKREKSLIRIKLKIGFGAYIREKKRETIKNNQAIHKLCNIFLDTLQTKFKSTIESLN
jgi:hypothetical protein